jgi:hypothetical protein
MESGLGVPWPVASTRCERREPPGAACGTWGSRGHLTARWAVGAGVTAPAGLQSRSP